MSFNRNSNKPRTFNTMHIDTSNWPAQHRFISNLPDQVTDFNEPHWLGLMFPSRDYQRRFDDFLAIRRKLTRLDLLADYNGNRANITEDQVRTRLQNSNEINVVAQRFAIMNKSILHAHEPNAVSYMSNEMKTWRERQAMECKTLWLRDTSL